MIAETAPAHEGELRQLRLRQAELETENGHLRGQVQRLQAELSAAQACAAELAHQAGVRLAAASHDLRQPLAALGIYASVLKSHVAPAGQPLLAGMKECLAGLSELLAKR